MKDNVLCDNIYLEKEHKTNEIKRVFRENRREEKTDWVPQERFAAYLNRNVLETFENDNTFDIVIE